jgi:4'-phosphopantetheinyl transferase
MMRHLIAGRLGVQPADLAFALGPHGKPTLAHPTSPIRFNLSHSGGFAALALAHGCEVGIDIEAMRPINEDIAERYFSPFEIAALHALPARERPPAFFRCWTRKEAVIKATGEGLARRLDSFDVSIATDPARVVRFVGVADPARHISLVHFEVASDIVGALAALPATTTTPVIEHLT